MPSDIPHGRSFFWQGAFILLPVAVLAIVSLVSLREDERAAENDARSKAVQNAESLARAMRSSVDEAFGGFVTHENDCIKVLRQPDLKLSAAIVGWGELQIGLAGEITADGRQMIPAEPPVVPTPPRWFRELSPAQRVAWERLRSVTDLTEIKKFQRAFLAANPPEDARLAALWLTNSPEQILGSRRRLETESGISYQTVACYRLLCATNAQLSDSLLNSLWRETIENPSFVAPKLLDLAGGLTSNDIATRRDVQWMRTVWNAQSRTSGYLDSIRRWPDLQPWKAQEWSRWTDDGEMLAIFEPEKAPSPRYKVFFMRAALVKMLFEKALEANKFLVPEYAGVGVTVGSRPVILAADQKNLLGSANTTAAPGNLPFDVKLFLTSREQMLSSERRREKLIAGLVLGAVFATLAGLVAAQRAFRRQLQLYEMKSNFVSSVSHELRAPIASVRLMAENLEGGKIPELHKQTDYFGFIVQECRRLSSLIENVLDFSRIEQGRKEYEFEPTDLTALTQTTVKLMEPYAAEKGVNLELTAGGHIEWNADGRAIQQALVNLIDNAVKHSAKGESVIVEIENSDVGVCLSVTDRGPGIPKAEHERIFERFYRRGSELRRATQGVGIGLSVVKHIVEAHGGRIVVRSEPGRGTQFTIELPARRQNE